MLNKELLPCKIVTTSITLIELAKGFINSAFDKSGTVEYLGFKFDKSDGEALVNLLEKYKDTP